MPFPTSEKLSAPNREKGGVLTLSDRPAPVRWLSDSGTLEILTLSNVYLRPLLVFIPRMQGSYVGAKLEKFSIK